MTEKTTRTIFIDADPDAIMKIISDIELYPTWIKEYKEAKVLEVDDQGYPLKARIVLDATILKDTLLLAYSWSHDRRTIQWSLLSSSLLRGLDGGYQLIPEGSGTKVIYHLSVDLMVPMIGLLKRKAEQRLTDTALQDLKRRAEAERTH